tara:strand:+ start:8109 stop:8429 length:321 start_codon:yes stop_codon:yes gene_type:complete
MSGTVFVTQDSPGRNFFPALKYGELVPLFPGNAQVVLSATPTIRSLKTKLKNFNDEDFLLLTGDPVIMGLSITIALELNLGRAKLLKWDRQERDYFPVTINLHEKG